MTETYADRYKEDRINVNATERLASVIGGGLLTLYGVRRGSLTGLALAAVGGSLVYRGATGHCATYQALGIDTAHDREREHPSEISIREALTIEAPRHDLYAFWRDLENLPQFMRHIESVRPMGEGLSVWTARKPGGGEIVWEAQITADESGKRIAWQSLPGADIENSGEVVFEDGLQGTEVHVVIDYRPTGLAGIAAGWINPVLSQMVREDIRRFKSLMEAGEAPTVEGQPRGH